MAGNKLGTGYIDNYLRFVQQNFNVGSGNFKNVLTMLEEYSNSYELTKRLELAERRRKEMAEDLSSRLKDIPILVDHNKYSKFDSLGNYGFSDKGLIDTIRVADDIINDIDIARDWLDSYNKFISDAGNSLEGMREELLLLGKSILGRAIELTPKDTGFLRASGTVLDFGDYIIIAFSAPYASYVHENLEVSHPFHTSNTNCGGRAKFLEIALQEFFPDRTVWVEVTGYSGVMAKISINPLLVEYSHYK